MGPGHFQDRRSHSFRYPGQGGTRRGPADSSGFRHSLQIKGWFSDRTGKRKPGMKGFNGMTARVPGGNGDISKPTRKEKKMIKKIVGTSLVLALLAGTALPADQAPTRLLNVSYDPTREFYAEYDRAFSAYWKQE